MRFPFIAMARMNMASMPDVVLAPSAGGRVAGGGVSGRMGGEPRKGMQVEAMATAVGGRTATLSRTTNETDIFCKLDLDGTGRVSVQTGIGFFDHMLDAFGRHGLFDLELRATGDLQVDGHHTVEDCGIVLGQAFAQAVGEKRGICRFGSCTLPMDEALVLAALDFSGRGALFWRCNVPLQMVGAFDTALAKEFFIAFAANAGLTLHLQQLAGENAHHLIEAQFKACGRALRQAVAIDPRAADAMPSTKGVL